MNRKADCLIALSIFMACATLSASLIVDLVRPKCAEPAPQVEPIELPAMLNGQAVRLFLDGSETRTVAYDVGAHWAIINADTMSAVLVPKQ